MSRLRSLLLALIFALLLSQPVQAQGDAPLALVLTADGPITPAMLEYFERGLEIAERRGAEVIIIQLNTPGGDVGTTTEIIQRFRASRVPVVVYVTPNGAMAGSAGAIITMAAHVAAMAPETAIGAASPISGTGEDLTETLEKKAKEIIKATIRPLVARRGEEAATLAEEMIENAKAVSASEALQAGLIDFVAKDLDDLLEALDGLTVETAAGPDVLHTRGARVEVLPLSFIEQLLLLLTDPNIVFVLLNIGVTALFIELSSPGGWVAGFIGVVCLALAVYGMGVLPVNWFGLIFLIIAFVLFVLDVKAPTHGALTAAGIASFVVGALVLFNSPGTPEFQRVSLPLVILSSLFTGVIFAIIVGFALRAQRAPIRIGQESLAHKTGIAKTAIDPRGQVQVESELWSAELAEGSEPIRKGERVEVVRVEGLRLKVRKM